MIDGDSGSSSGKDSLRILLVCQGDLTSASTKQAVAFAEGLVARGHSVLLSLSGDATSVDREGIHNHPRFTVSFRREYAFLMGRESLRQAQRFRPHVLHAFNPRHYTVNVARQFHRVTKAAVVVHWEDDEVGIRRGVVKRTPIRRLGRLARRILCYPWPRQGVFITRSSLRWVQQNASMCDALTPALAASVRDEAGLACMTVFPSFVGYDQGESGSDPLAGQPEPILNASKIAYTGSVHTESIDDFRLAIRAVALVVRRGYDVAFLYAGQALPRYDVIAIAEREGLPANRVASLGYVPFRQVRSILASASVLVQPGQPNRFNQLRLPSKVQAYLQSGTPTVMFSVGLGELLKDGAEVVKLHGFTAEELAERIVELLDDPGLAARVGEGGQRAAQRLFDRDRNVAALVYCYRVALETDAASSKSAPTKLIR